MKIELLIDNDVFAVITPNTDRIGLNLGEFINVLFDDIYLSLDFDINDYI